MRQLRGVRLKLASRTTIRVTPEFRLFWRFQPEPGIPVCWVLEISANSDSPPFFCLLRIRKSPPTIQHYALNLALNTVNAEQKKRAYFNCGMGLFSYCCSTSTCSYSFSPSSFSSILKVSGCPERKSLIMANSASLMRYDSNSSPSSEASSAAPSSLLSLLMGFAITT